jgi:hypothetical protein
MLPVFPAELLSRRLLSVNLISESDVEDEFSVLIFESQGLMVYSYEFR